jgi:hypothetical protein
LQALVDGVHVFLVLGLQGLPQHMVGKQIVFKLILFLFFNQFFLLLYFLNNQLILWLYRDYFFTTTR